MKKNCLLALVILCIFSLNTNAQSNGYRLEFFNGITLSNDSIALPSVGNDRLKSYTVPAGCVLKITSGIVSSLVYNNAYIYLTILNVDNNKIMPQTTTVSPWIINGDAPLWVPEGKTVSLVTSRGTGTPAGFQYSQVTNCWISGVVFKLVAN